ncbi:unnamed protein product [Macrosiphum euphorbiae]|uniref:Uncharacterized protein n=1 Tax=Macrosiphum euphorbiae TaxID=13131 RepID=A0AAV0XNH9_9HEMI|nr:unnamed protein product [Macrosiphum euphorbiae]
MVESAKADVWQTVKAKINNPKAKTIVCGKAIIIIPDDANTLEVMRGLQNVKEIGPKKPRVIIYDVESGIVKEELAECLLAQNAELGLTDEDINNMIPLHNLAPERRYGPLGGCSIPECSKQGCLTGNDRTCENHSAQHEQAKSCQPAVEG